PLPEVCTAIIVKEKPSVKDDSFLKISAPCLALYSSSNCIEIHNAGQAGQEKASNHEYTLLLFMPSDSPLDDDDVPNKGDEGVSKVLKIMPSLEETGIFDDVHDDREVGAEADINNLELLTVVCLIPTIRVHKDHPKEQIISDLNLATQTKRMINFSEENAMVSYINKQRRTNYKDYQNCLFACFFSQQEPKKVIQALADPSWIEAMQEELLKFKLQKMDVKSVFMYDTIEEEVYVCHPPGFEDPHLPNKVYKLEKALYGLHQAPRKSLCDEFEQMMHNKFQMSSMVELARFLGLQTVSTLMEPNKALIKDVKAEDADVHLYRLIIGSLIYLTTSRPDIMFVVCACVKFQVTAKISHLHAVKRIFRYLKGQPKLGLWYPRDSPFDLKAFSDSDYAGTSLDRKSTTGGCQFLGKRLISW
nr:hypothetical protein [Tanacetum cinerariifolium]